jgi:ABC-type polysaccharide/polyol phosphate transport system ATPase subunit
VSALIEVRDVTKRFRMPSEARRTIREHLFGLLRPLRWQTIEVLRGVSFELKPGETLGIMGGNGAGKSTLLKLICGIYEPTTGSVTLRGEIAPILELGLGWNTELDAVDNILLVSTIMGLGLREARASVERVLAFAELERFANLQLKHFSSGMAARLAYSVAFHAAREVLILDEVLAVGDHAFRAKCMARYRELIAVGHSSIVVSHTPGEVAEGCQRALLLEDGRFVLEDTGQAVADAYVARLRADEDEDDHDPLPSA